MSMRFPFGSGLFSFRFRFWFSFTDVKVFAQYRELGGNTQARTLAPTAEKRSRI